MHATNSVPFSWVLTGPETQSRLAMPHLSRVRRLQVHLVVTRLSSLDADTYTDTAA